MLMTQACAGMSAKHREHELLLPIGSTACSHPLAALLANTRDRADTCFALMASRCFWVSGPSVPLIAPTVPMGHSSVMPARHRYLVLADANARAATRRASTLLPSSSVGQHCSTLRPCSAQLALLLEQVTAAVCADISGRPHAACAVRLLAQQAIASMDSNVQSRPQARALPHWCRTSTP